MGSGGSVGDTCPCKIVQVRRHLYLTAAASVFHELRQLILKAPSTTAADDIHKHFLLLFRENKTGCFK